MDAAHDREIDLVDLFEENDYSGIPDQVGQDWSICGICGEEFDSKGVSYTCQECKGIK